MYLVCFHFYFSLYANLYANGLKFAPLIFQYVCTIKERFSVTNHVVTC